VADWNQAKMIEDHRSTVSLIEPIFDLRYHHRGKPLNVKRCCKFRLVK
jgi:hypothetical protein